MTYDSIFEQLKRTRDSGNKVSRVGQLGVRGIGYYLDTYIEGDKLVVAAGVGPDTLVEIIHNQSDRTLSDFAYKFKDFMPKRDDE